MSDAEALAFVDEMYRASLFSPGHWIQLGIAEPDADRLIGDIGLYLSEDGASGEVGYTLQPDYQGRGIATLAVREALQLLFSETGVAFVTGVTDKRNLPSINVLDRLGFEFVASRYVVFRDEPCTELVYRLKRSDSVYLGA